MSFAGKPIQELKKQDYWVCEKTDGMRFLMYLTNDGEQPVHYLIDRKNNYYYVRELHFPHHEDKTFTRFHIGTILDGELVEDRLPGREPVMKFLVFDLLCIDSTKMMHRPLDKRLAYFKSQVLEPYKAFTKAHPTTQRPFVLEDKNTEFSYAVEKMFKEIIPRVKQLHGNDGLIFTCKNTAYKHGTDEHILKWKPPQENTIDLLMHITWPVFRDFQDPEPQTDYLAFPTRFELFVHVTSDRGVGEYHYFDDLYVTPEDWEHMKALGIPLQDVVVECFQEAVPQTVPLPDLDQCQSDGTNGMSNGHGPTNGADGHAMKTRWRFHRFRDDKLEANHVSVVESVMGSIADRVTEQDLLDAAPSIRAAWKDREAAARRSGSVATVPPAAVKH